MASESFISYKEKGFWIVNDFISLIARYFIETYKSNKYNSHWRGLLKNKFLLTSLGGYSLSLYFDEFIDNEYKYNDFINWINETKLYLKSKGNIISKEELNSFDKFFEIYSDYDKELETSILIDLFNDIMLIIEKKGENINSKKLLPYFR